MEGGSYCWKLPILRSHPGAQIFPEDHFMLNPEIPEKIFNPNYEININTGWRQVHIRASHVDKDDAPTTPAGINHHCFTKNSEAPSGQKEFNATIFTN